MIVTPTNEELLSYKENLLNNYQSMGIDPLLVDHIPMLIEKGLVPLWSCQGHHCGDKGYLTLYRDEQSIEIILKVLDRLYRDRAFTYATKPDVPEDTYTSLRSDMGILMCADKFGYSEFGWLNTISINWIHVDEEDNAENINKLMTTLKEI